MITLKPETMKQREISPLDLVSIKDILGCLYYVYTKEIIVMIDRVEQGYSVTSSMHEIDEKSDNFTLTVEDGVYFKIKERIKVSFEISSMRYSFVTTVFTVEEDSSITIKIPVGIHHDEHRTLPRVPLPETMSDCFELASGLFSGVRVKGKVEDISLGGLRFSPNHFRSRKNSDEIDMKNTKIKPGTKFKKLKVELDKKTLNIPVEVRYSPSKGDNSFGIKFNIPKKGTKHGNKLREFIESCAPQKSVINFASFYDNLKSEKGS